MPLIFIELPVFIKAEIAGGSSDDIDRQTQAVIKQHLERILVTGEVILHPEHAINVDIDMAPRTGEPKHFEGELNYDRAPKH